MLNKDLTEIRNKILNLTDTMGSSCIENYVEDAKKIRESFYQMLVNRLPLDIVEKIVYCCSEPVYINLDWGELFFTLRKYSQVNIERFNRIEELGRVNCKFLLAIVETKDSSYPENIAEIMNNIIGDADCSWCCSRAEEENVILLKFN